MAWFCILMPSHIDPGLYDHKDDDLNANRSHAGELFQQTSQRLDALQVGPAALQG